MPDLNYVDALILIALALYTALQARVGFFALTGKLISFVGAIIISFQSYAVISEFLVERLDLLPGLSDAVSFTGLFILSQMLLGFILKNFFTLLPARILESRWNKIFGIVPAFVDTVVIISLILFVLVIFPAFPDVKEDVSDSHLGSILVEQILEIEYYLLEIFGGLGQESLTFLTVRPESTETLPLPYEAKNLTVDERAEQEMLRLLNQERLKAGVNILRWDESIVPVARAHSRDMWERSYFSHTNPEGEGPGERMEEGEVRFVSAGENLALARTVEQAHQGLMNSPGHRRNILDPNFVRIGIGAIEGGIYGIMFTQNFAR